MDGGDEFADAFKVCTIGPIGVGKTCLIKRYVNDEFDDAEVPTIG